jgi:hypothetical protein
LPAVPALPPFVAPPEPPVAGVEESDELQAQIEQPANNKTAREPTNEEDLIETSKG